MGRINEISALIDNCESFADVGCDHGYIALSVLQSGKCKSVTVTDISAKCLAKAEKLLADYICDGRCRAVCCDGLKGVSSDTEQVLVAGMGGEEIIKILSEGFIPKKFILQPMKNADKVRKFLLSRGCKIVYDGIFKDGKYYFVIKGERYGGGEIYSDVQLAFGRDSIGGSILKEFADNEIKKCKTYFAACADAVRRAELSTQIKLLAEVLK